MPETRYAAAARAAATTRAYGCDWRDFERWCLSHDRTPLPAPPETVAEYLEARASTLKPSTLRRRLIAIGERHAAAGHESPRRAPLVRDTMQGIRRTHAHQPARKAAVTLLQLRMMLGELGEDLAGIRDRAIILLGFAGAMRRSELAGLDVADLAHRDDGLVVTVRRSKTDQEARGRELGIGLGQHPDTCPVRALMAWTSAAGLTSGPLFRQVDRWGNVGDRRISGAGVALIVKRAAAAAGLNPDQFAGHSLRAGFVTVAYELGLRELEIAEQTGHRSLEVLRGYIRHEDPLAHSPSRKLGL